MRLTHQNRLRERERVCERSDFVQLRDFGRTLENLMLVTLSLSSDRGTEYPLFSGLRNKLERTWSSSQVVNHRKPIFLNANAKERGRTDRKRERPR